MTKEINVYIEENNVNTCIYIYTEFAHMQDKGIDKIDGLKLYRKQNSTHTDIYIYILRSRSLYNIFCLQREFC
jgi:predicted transcriptional regulator YdeE